MVSHKRWRGTWVKEICLDEEEIADVSVATFYVFDKEAAGTFPVRLAGGF